MLILVQLSTEILHVLYTGFIQKRQECLHEIQTRLKNQVLFFRQFRERSIPLVRRKWCIFLQVYIYLYVINIPCCQLSWRRWVHVFVHSIHLCVSGWLSKYMLPRLSITSFERYNWRDFQACGWKQSGIHESPCCCGHHPPKCHPVQLLWQWRR